MHLRENQWARPSVGLTSSQCLMMGFSDPLTALCLCLPLSVSSKIHSVRKREALLIRKCIWNLICLEGWGEPSCLVSDSWTDSWLQVYFLSELRGFVVDFQHYWCWRESASARVLFFSRWPSFLSVNRIWDLLPLGRKLLDADSIFSEWYKMKFLPPHPALVYPSVKSCSPSIFETCVPGC